MAFASVGTVGNNGSTSNNQASLTITTSAAVEAGNLLVVIVAVDNNATSDGDDGAVSGVTAGGVAMTKARQHANGNALAAGCSCSIWYQKRATQLNSASSIVITFGTAANADETAASAWEFTTGSSGVAVENSNASAVDAGAHGSLDATTANIECLRVRATATESATTTAWTATAGGFNLMTLRGSGGATDAAQHIRGEFKISTTTTDPSNPTGGVNPADHASVYVAFKEVNFNAKQAMFAVL